MGQPWHYHRLMKIRTAEMKDVSQIAKLINYWAEYGVMLHRSLDTLYEQVRHFHVAVEGQKVIGVCGLKVVWSHLGEVYALAVAKGHQGKGVGKKLVRACIASAEALGIKRLMTLTYEAIFFDKLGFVLVDREDLPLKVWSECLSCAKNHACDEIAMMLVLENVTEVLGDGGTSQSLGVYDVPVPITISVSREGPRQRMD